MADLAPVDNQPEFDHSLVPVEYDPFAAEQFVPQAAADWTKQAAPKDVATLKNVGSGIESLATLPQRAIENSQYSLDTGNYDPGPTLEAATLPMGTGAIAGVPVRAGEAVLGAGPIRAFHGSPHDFDAFDMSKIGTGEGAQAYGHGLYFAENEGVAKQYEKALGAAKDLPSDVLAKYYEPGQIVRSYSGLDLVKKYDPSSRAVTVRSVDRQGNPTQDLLGLRDRVHTTQPSLAELNQAFKERGMPEYKPGHMYEVNINADPEHFLDWDKPLSEQPKGLQELVEKTQAERAAMEKYRPLQLTDIKRDSQGQPLNPSSGGQAYHYLASPRYGQDQNTAAVVLREAGIPGIKYLDQGSRGVPTVGNGHVQNIGGKYHIVDDFGVQAGPFDTHAEASQYLDPGKNLSRNYVVFNDKLIDIIKKYGIAGLPAGYAAAAAQQFAPVDHDPFAESQ